jgi:hypothetical protein
MSICSSLEITAMGFFLKVSFKNLAVVGLLLILDGGKSLFRQKSIVILSDFLM